MPQIEEDEVREFLSLFKTALKPGAYIVLLLEPFMLEKVFWSFSRYGFDFLTLERYISKASQNLITLGTRFHVALRQVVY